MDGNLGYHPIICRKEEENGKCISFGRRSDGSAYKNIGYLYHQSAMAVLLPAGCDNRGIHDGSLLYSYKSGQASVRQSYTKLFHSFRENLKDSLAVNLSYLALTGLLVFNIYTVYQSLETYEMALFLLFLYTACLFLIFMAGLYTYAFLSRFSMEERISL